MIKISIDTQISASLARKLAELEEPIDRETANRIGRETRDAMLKSIAEGVSPIDGIGKFPSYKRPEKYPGRRKAHSPVNLRLRGDFLEALTYETVPSDSGYGTQIFYGNDQEKKEKGHAEGANGQPKRPTIPAQQGQRFIERIRDVYTDIIEQRLLKIAKG